MHLVGSGSVEVWIYFLPTCHKGLHDHLHLVIFSTFFLIFLCKLRLASYVCFIWGKVCPQCPEGKCWPTIMWDFPLMFVLSEEKCVLSVQEGSVGQLWCGISLAPNKPNDMCFFAVYDLLLREIMSTVFYPQEGNASCNHSHQRCKKLQMLQIYLYYFFQLVLILDQFWVIFGPCWQIWVIFWPIWTILGHFWAILGNFRSFLGHFLVLIFFMCAI